MVCKEFRMLYTLLSKNNNIFVWYSGGSLTLCDAFSPSIISVSLLQRETACSESAINTPRSISPKAQGEPKHNTFNDAPRWSARHDPKLPAPNTRILRCGNACEWL